MLDIFQNSALIMVMFHFLTGLPKESMSGGESSTNRAYKYERQESESRITLAFDEKGFGFKLKKQSTLDGLSAPYRRNTSGNIS